MASIDSELTGEFCPSRGCEGNRAEQTQFFFILFSAPAPYLNKRSIKPALKVLKGSEVVPNVSIKAPCVARALVFPSCPRGSFPARSMADRDAIHAQHVAVIRSGTRPRLVSD